MSLNLCSSLSLFLFSSFHMLSESLDLTQHRMLNFLCPPFMWFQATGKIQGTHTHTHANTHGQTDRERERDAEKAADSRSVKTDSTARFHCLCMVAWISGLCSCERCCLSAASAPAKGLKCCFSTLMYVTNRCLKKWKCFFVLAVYSYHSRRFQFRWKTRTIEEQRAKWDTVWTCERQQKGKIKAVMRIKNELLLVILTRWTNMAPQHKNRILWVYLSLHFVSLLLSIPSRTLYTTQSHSLPVAVRQCFGSVMTIPDVA